MNSSVRWAAFFAAMTMTATAVSCSSDEGTADGGTRDAGDGGAGGGCPGDGAKRVLWGDLHVHTTFSFDAYTFNELNSPEDALAFARGGPARYPCGQDPAVSCQEKTLALPLDFVALTEHAEYLGVPSACGVDGSVENPAFCTTFETFILNNIDWIVAGNGPTPELLDAIGDTNAAWGRLQEAADEAYEPCEFTTLHAYEHTPQVNGAMLHRNVFFLGDDIPDSVVSFFEAEDGWELFNQLDAQCPPGPDGPDCEYITIPHNPNLSDGRMFNAPPTTADGPATVAQINQRARSDVLVEVFNHKGQSECQLGFSNPLASEEDAECAMENFKPICQGNDQDPPYCRNECTSVASASDSAEPEDCTSSLDMTRNALVEGLRLAPQFEGTNPFRIGFAGGTDTHNGDPGSVEEDKFEGHGGILDDEPAELLGRWRCANGADECAPALREWSPEALSFNPGGLTAIWAERNTRSGVFEALKRREAFATSGARIEARLYAGWELPTDLCAQLGAGAEGIEPESFGAVPMGGMLENPPPGGAPSFVVNAVADPITGNPLQRIEIIKGWVDAAGDGHLEVINIEGDASGPPPAPDCSVPLESEPERLCGRFTDPQFDPELRAFYYARVLENPSCRWSTRLCVDQGVDCGQLDASSGTFQGQFSGYEGCCDIERDQLQYSGTNRFDLISERALTSPVWY